MFFVVHTNYSVNFIPGALQVSEVVDLIKVLVLTFLGFQRERIIASRFIAADAIFTVLIIGATCYACVLAATVKDDYSNLLAIAFAIITIGQIYFFYAMFVFWKELKYWSKNSSNL